MRKPLPELDQHDHDLWKRFPEKKPHHLTSFSKPPGLPSANRWSAGTSKLTMARWTQWRKIADRSAWYPDVLDWDGPACYELGIAGARGGNLQIVYIGETSNEKKRVIAYASHGSHLSEIIRDHLARGWHLYYRARAARTKEEAERTQDNLLSRWDYDWNIKLNTWGK